MNYSESTNPLPQKLSLTKGSTLGLKSGEYIIENEIGKGGFGVVYTVKQISTGALYALKVLTLWEVHPNEYSPLTKRFNLEYKIGKTNSNFLVQSYYFGFIKGNPYIIMELCSNGNLSNEKFKYQDEAALVLLIDNLLSGLRALHINGIIHRDIKPENILYSNNMTIKIADYGISANINNRLTTTNIIGVAKERFGSVLFSAPETFKASKYFKQTKPTMDIYSLGVTLYFLASGGKYPIGSFEEYEKSPTEYVKKKKKGEFISLSSISPHLSSKVVRFIEKCFEPKIENRFQTIDEARQYISGIIEHYKTNNYIASDPVRLNGKNSTYNELMIIEGSKIGLSFNLDKIMDKVNRQVIFIGRKSKNDKINDIKIEELGTRYISKRQLSIEKIGDSWYARDGQFNIEDKEGWIDSLNGTIVDERKLFNGKEKKIKDGSIIKIGEVILKFIKKTK